MIIFVHSIMAMQLKKSTIQTIAPKEIWVHL